ncbi:MAG TPA: hypothetical protein VFH92_01345 [Phenylobacterium sp.]|nr:hypothetical protein [Phenylobacterium sp.]
MRSPITSRREVLCSLAASPIALGSSGDENAAYRWANVKVGGGGFVPNVVFSRAERGLAYLRSDMGGAYRWDAAAARWAPLLDGLAESSWQGVESVAPDPVDPNVVYLACGMYRGAPAAILRSTNRGKDWNIFPVPFRMGGNEDGRGLGERLAIDPNQPSTLWFGSRHDGLLRSRDRGETWTRVAAFPHGGLGTPVGRGATHGGVSFVVADPRSGRPGGGSRTLFVGVGDPSDHALWRTDDAGETWRPLPTPPGLFACKAELDGSGLLYVTCSNGIGPNGVTDGAVLRVDTHTDAVADITPERPRPDMPGGFMGVSVDRSRPGALAVASLNRWKPYDTVWRTSDHGETWFGIERQSRRDVSATPFLLWGEPEADIGWWMAGLAIDPFDPDFACYTTGATIYATRQFSRVGSDQPITWFPWVEGIEQTAVLTLTSLPEGPPLLSGFGDISGFAHEDLTVSPRLQFTSPVFANTDSIDYAGRAPQVVVRSGTHHPRHEGPTLAWSEDHGRSWRPLAAPEQSHAASLPGARGDPARDSAIAVSADGAGFIVMRPRPVISRDRGATWRECAGLPMWTRPVADRVDASRFYALDFATGRLFASRDGGQTFTEVATSGLPSGLSADRPTWREQAWPLRATPGRPGELWLTSRQGLFRSRDGGARFVRVGADIGIEAMDFGAPPPGRTFPAMFAIGLRDGVRAIWRSDDEGRRWIRLNDSRHEYGRRFRCLAADPRVFGRVYVGTDGRGIVYGEPA